MLVGKTNSKDTFDHELIVKEVADGDFSNGVGSVLVNILTSMRHLPPVMHSVLLIMALTWMIVSLGAGPWDALFGGGSIPAFVLPSISAIASGILAIKKLPHLSRNSVKSSGFHGFD
ncbi:Sucrose transport protein SUT4 [Acorus calamus]|uniref:Sucrose transport protein SUT4 n=1 Tax=Acorus calamus TaxID=4465 RepID=A0AAV9CL41_ACOCL|nr:Sucrose transport protein SUT4 [Acorus calamus]